MKCAVIYNPKARNSGRLTPTAIEALAARHGAEVEVYETTKRGDGIGLAARAAEAGVARLYPAGGDGTLNEAITGLMEYKSARPDAALPVVCPIPLGTVNVFSKEMGFSTDPAKAFEESFAAEERKVDIGGCNDRYFVMMVSAGFDGFIINELEAMIARKSKIKKYSGPFAYVIVGLRALLRYGFPKMRATAVSVFGKKEFTGDFMLVSNSRYYGGRYVLNQAVSVGDGFLDLLVFNSRSRFEYLKFFGLVMLGRSEFPGLDITKVPVRECRIEYAESGKGETWSQVDGELYQSPPLEVRVHPKAVTVLAPVADGLKR